MSILYWVVIFLALSTTLAFNHASRRVWGVSNAVFFIVFSVVLAPPIWFLIVFGLLLGPLLVCVNIKPLRLAVTRKILYQFRQAMPRLSATEKAALSAGDVGWEAQFFTGKMDGNLLSQINKPTLTDEEKSFLQNETVRLCEMADDWRINHVDYAIADDVWNYIRQVGFFGLVIPKKYGGKEFSPLAHAEIISKIATKSGALATAVCVPNSLGPAELLLAYGTDAQKEYYLPRLANGTEVPCFALTSPVAGSDANAIVDQGVVCHAMIDGKKQLAIRLNWDKRYITLAPVATLIGLAFKLYDPEHLLGEQDALGITCALIPADTDGVSIGRRHFPLCSAFPNGPTQGRDVVVSMDNIIGGVAMAGKGWQMLMENLAAGRGISLPSVVAGGAKRAVYLTGAYARMRRQFNTYIGAFDGVKASLAKMGGSLYLLQALRVFTVSQIQNGIHSATASAISKYHTTELARCIIQWTMDVQGGKGICMGENNFIAQAYIESPISITVEGANILTRALIIFGQGVIRCHPCLLKEIQAANAADDTLALHQFDAVFWSHIKLLLGSKVRAFLLGLTKGRLASIPKLAPLASSDEAFITQALKPYYYQCARWTAAFAFLSEVSVVVLGAKLKRMERLSSRLGDMLSYLTMAVAVLVYYRQHPYPDDAPIMHWVLQQVFHRLQETVYSFLANFPKKIMGKLLQKIVCPLGRSCSPPSDALSHQVADLLLKTSPTRSRLLTSEFVEQENLLSHFVKIDETLRLTLATEGLLKKISLAKQAGRIKAVELTEQVQEAYAMNIINATGKAELLKTLALQQAILKVDDFAADFFNRYSNKVEDESKNMAG